MDTSLKDYLKAMSKIKEKLLLVHPAIVLMSRYIIVPQYLGHSQTQLQSRDAGALRLLLVHLTNTVE